MRVDPAVEERLREAFARSREAVLRARSVREKGKFLATASHELRQPLNAALAALRLVEIGGDSAETARNILRRQLLLMTRLVEDLLDMSRMSLDAMEMRLGHVDLRAVLDDAAATVVSDVASRGLTLITARVDSDICVWGDDSRPR
jgi:signal transduction histidine kinase